MFCALLLLVLYEIRLFEFLHCSDFNFSDCIRIKLPKKKTHHACVNHEYTVGVLTHLSLRNNQRPLHIYSSSYYYIII